MDIPARDGGSGLRIATPCRAVGVTSGWIHHHVGGWPGVVRACSRTGSTSRPTACWRSPGPCRTRGARRVTKRTTAALRHDVEVAIRAWVAVDPVVGEAQRDSTSNGAPHLPRSSAASSTTRPRPRGRRSPGVRLLVRSRQTVPDVAETTPSGIFDEYVDLLLRHARRSPSSRP
jgi:hypothetical protein